MGDGRAIAAGRELAGQYDGVLSRRLLSGLGVDRDRVAREVAGGRWSTHGRQTVAVHTAPIGPEARRWRAVWETGERITALDGVTALQAAGMTGFDDDRVHVSVRHTNHLRPLDRIEVHKVIRRTEDEVVPGGIPRTRPAVAAIRAAHWAVTDRQAALLLVMPVQQRLVRSADLVATRRNVRGRTRRAFISQVIHDIHDGAHSLGELDFAAVCRSRGIPEPSRQVVRHGPRGRIYLDVAWEDIGLAVEIDGAGHQWGLAVATDNLRQNRLVLDGEVVLRIDLIGLRLWPEEFLDQVVEAHRACSVRRTS